MAVYFRALFARITVSPLKTHGQHLVKERPVLCVQRSQRHAARGLFGKAPFGAEYFVNDSRALAAGNSHYRDAALAPRRGQRRNCIFCHSMRSYIPSFKINYSAVCQRW